MLFVMSVEHFLAIASGSHNAAVILLEVVAGRLVVLVVHGLAITNNFLMLVELASCLHLQLGISVFKHFFQPSFRAM